MKLSEYQRSRSFFDLVKGHSDFNVKLFDFGRYTQVSDPGPHGPLVKYILLGGRKNWFDVGDLGPKSRSQEVKGLKKLPVCTLFSEWMDRF